jgi:hypothetical protein
MVCSLAGQSPSSPSSSPPSTSSSSSSATQSPTTSSSSTSHRTDGSPSSSTSLSIVINPVPVPPGGDPSKPGAESDFLSYISLFFFLAGYLPVSKMFLEKEHDWLENVIAWCCRDTTCADLVFYLQKKQAHRLPHQPVVMMPDAWRIRHCMPFSGSD